MLESCGRATPTVRLRPQRRHCKMNQTNIPLNIDLRALIAPKEPLETARIAFENSQ